MPGARARCNAMAASGCASLNYPNSSSVSSHFESDLPTSSMPNSFASYSVCVAERGVRDRCAIGQCWWRRAGRARRVRCCWRRAAATLRRVRLRAPPTPPSTACPRPGDPGPPALYPAPLLICSLVLFRHSSVSQTNVPRIAAPRSLSSYEHLSSLLSLYMQSTCERTRTRDVETPASGGGRECTLSDTESCSDCAASPSGGIPINCLVTSWGSWSDSFGFELLIFSIALIILHFFVFGSCLSFIDFFALPLMLLLEADLHSLVSVS